MSTTAQDFVTTSGQMSFAAKDYFGRSADGLQTLRPKGSVRMAPLVIEGEDRANGAPPAPRSP